MPNGRILRKDFLLLNLLCAYFFMKCFFDDDLALN